MSQQTKEIKPEKETLLRVSGASAGYGGPPVIRALDFTVEAGTRIGVLGQNGGGKSTLFKALLGEIEIAGGEVDVRTRLGTVPQTERSRLDYPVSALDVALMGSLGRLPWWKRPGRREREMAKSALHSVGLEEMADRSFGELSGGQRQRVLISRALVQDAKVLLLDEPFSGLDRPSSESLTRLIDQLAREGRAVMIATHDLEQVRGWDLVLCLNGRQIAFGSPQDVLNRSVIEATYGAQVTVLSDDEDEAGVRAILPPHHCERDH